MIVGANENNLTKSDGEDSSSIVFIDKIAHAEIKAHFHSIALSHSQKLNLEHMLLSYSPAFHSKRHSNNTQSPSARGMYLFLKKNKSVIFSHIATASAAIFITLGFAYYAHSTIESAPRDLVSDVVSLSDNLNFPADFNLDGDLKDLPDLIHESLPNQSFSPAIPVQIAQDFSAYEGRFFLFNGEQGVGISVLPSSHEKSRLLLPLQKNFTPSQPSTFYIVKLSDKNKASFPAQKVTRKIASASGKIKRVYAWRNGTYGYAMVQPVEFEE